MSVFVPDVLFNSITDISKDYMDCHGIKALILDVDNTLTEHGSQELSSKISEWLIKMREQNVKMMIVSNNTHKRVEPFAKRLGLDFVSMGLKPMTRGFTKAQAIFKLKASEIMVVGDQIFTDITGGNLKGMHTALVMPIKLETGVFFRLKRKFEKRYINKMEQNK